MQGVPTGDLLRIVGDTNRLRPGEVPFSETVSPPESPAVTLGERPQRFTPIRGPEVRVEPPPVKPADAPFEREGIEAAGISLKTTEGTLTPKVDLKTIPTEELLKLATEVGPEIAPTTLQRKPFRLGTVGEPDLLNVIDDIGGIRPRTASGDPANYDGFDEVIPRGETRLLVRKTGLAPDDLRQALSGRGYSFETTSDLYSAIARAKETR